MTNWAPPLLDSASAGQKSRRVAREFKQAHRVFVCSEVVLAVWGRCIS